MLAITLGLLSLEAKIGLILKHIITSSPAAEEYFKCKVICGGGSVSVKLEEYGVENQKLKMEQ